MAGMSLPISRQRRSSLALTIALLLCLTLLLCACGVTWGLPGPVMRSSIDLQFRAAEVDASGYVPNGASDRDARIDYFHVRQLLRSRFVLVFPDGFRVNSDELTETALQDHGNSLGRGVRVSHDDGHLWLSWRSESGGMTTEFRLRDGRAYDMAVCSPASGLKSQDRALRFETVDAVQVTYPMTYNELTLLFGEATVVRHDFTIAKWHC
jgi:hypothetical protein